MHGGHQFVSRASLGGERRASGWLWCSRVAAQKEPSSTRGLFWYHAQGILSINPPVLR